MLQARDVLALRVSDVTDHTGTVVEEFTVRQRKTGHGQLATHTRQSLTDWIRASAKAQDDFLFTSTGNRNYGDASREQYANPHEEMGQHCPARPSASQTHSMRRSKPATVY